MPQDPTSAATAAAATAAAAAAMDALTHVDADKVGSAAKDAASAYAWPAANWLRSVFEAGQTKEHHLGGKSANPGAVGDVAAAVAEAVNTVSSSLGFGAIVLPAGAAAAASAGIVMRHLPLHYSPAAALVGSAVLTGVYVGSLYIWPLLAKLGVASLSPADPRAIDRDDPKVVPTRFASATLACVASVGIVKLLATPRFAGFPVPSGFFSRLLGFHTDRLILGAIAPLALTATLFAGPLVGMYYSRDFPWQHEGFELRPFVEATVKDLLWWRNIVVGPVTEEITFRACMLPMLASAFGGRGALLVAPVMFGSAHLHSIIQHLRKTDQEIKAAWSGILLQLAYTTVFGVYASALFLRTGHIIAPILSHSLCNYIGFPDVEGVANHPRKHVIAAAYVFGLLGFGLLLLPVTSPHYYHSIFYGFR
ncbi:hypothetical protein CAOG_01076 [Capsaspora owczarzaki ATCC 30864]|uniref:intramembrane prenyl-peptidase Rce1 n=1 Tax=Capsaspora owczarzaki (strain ATCC 30864) TaxID=595528 RepID=A0A0D2WII7_CAPO3|nr:hypothetical protein CAOG_01076 [Capsaspora owczarzaki ATCC 30864]KJE89640.1 hypothetical protein CAOG_001076 [Capsaspora owczarzaki ATCC 30864]|eukprot:XP_004365947.1 hypothetical protein CAOG_01076 [Capsaspora owczarzaki ATCC 30864]